MSYNPGIVNPKFYVCTNEDCQIGVPSWSGMGKPSGRKCGFCGQETRETKSEPLDSPHARGGCHRRGAGRPVLSETEPTVKIEITLPASLRDKLDGLTDNRSAWVRQAIEAA